MSAPLIQPKKWPLVSAENLARKVKAEPGALALLARGPVRPMADGRGSCPVNLIRILDVTVGGEIRRYVRLETDEEPELSIWWGTRIMEIVDVSRFDPDRVIRAYRDFLDDRISQALDRTVMGEELIRCRRRIRPWDNLAQALAALETAARRSDAA